MAPRSKPNSKPAQQTAAQNGTSPPDWPQIAPILPASDLSFEVLLDDQILTISNLWTSGLCKRYINFLATLPFLTTPGRPKKGEAVRVNDRFQITDQAFAHRLWSDTALQSMVENAVIDGEQLTNEQRTELWGGEVLGLNSNIRIYRYTPGQFFAQHYDDYNDITFTTAEGDSIPARTTWTMLLYLSSPVTGCIGGETVFYPEPASKREAAPAPIVADLEIGTVLLHRHGADCLLHEGREVTAGEKWVIRSDLCVKR